jgi:hypothetical protein
MTVALAPKSGVFDPASLVVLYVDGSSQPDVGCLAHQNDTTPPGSFGHGGCAAQTAHGVISCRGPKPLRASVARTMLPTPGKDRYVALCPH